jgi:hypothetical protein
MSDVHYTDLTSETFRLALEGMRDKVPAELREELGALLSRGEIHNPAAILEAINRQADKAIHGAD